MIIDNKFEYNKIIYSAGEQEEILSNWFRVKSFPELIYLAPTYYRKKREITNKLKRYYSFILKDKWLYSFSDFKKGDCELKEFCDYQNGFEKNFSEISEKYFIELLNNVIVINFLKLNLIRTSESGERFFFSPIVLKNPSHNKFFYKPLRKNKEENRAKIYITKKGNIIEYKHLALKVNFHRLNSDLYFEIEPDWQFSYPNNPNKTKKEIGIRITKEKANMFNQQYLYLLHALKQLLSDSSKYMIFPCDDQADSQQLVINTSNLSFISNFKLFNDYFGPNL